MPELPDVELFKRHLDATCLDRTIRGVTVNDARIISGISASELARRLTDARLTDSRRHGNTYWWDSIRRAAWPCISA